MDFSDWRPHPTSALPVGNLSLDHSSTLIPAVMPPPTACRLPSCKPTSLLLNPGRPLASITIGDDGIVTEMAPDARRERAYRPHQCGRGVG